MSIEDEWARERTEVLKALALLERGISDLQSDFADLRKGLTQTLDELKDQAAARQKQINDFLIDYAGRRVQIETMRIEMDGLKDRVKEIEKLAPAVRVMMWVGALLGASIIALIWALITGRAQVVFQ